eukprot:GEMP01046215.1.p1 GENE.GEMP01046215.1~~GEMP01046215.1.p1  ORF type:complete len:194 (+),score=45.12 GEMP01046215.1:171-752(+)
MGCIESRAGKEPEELIVEMPEIQIIEKSVEEVIMGVVIEVSTMVYEGKIIERPIENLVYVEKVIEVPKIPKRIMHEIPDNSELVRQHAKRVPVLNTIDECTEDLIDGVQRAPSPTRSSAMAAMSFEDALGRIDDHEYANTTNGIGFIQCGETELQYGRDIFFNQESTQMDMQEMKEILWRKISGDEGSGHRIL